MRQLMNRIFGRGQQQARGVEVVTDLDAILTRTVGFRFGGRVHRIPPLDVQQFFGATNALARLDELRTKKTLTADELLSAYEGIFGVVCPTIKRKDVEKMSQHQVAALFQLVLELIMGKSELQAQKKSSSEPTEASEKPPAMVG